MSEYTARNRSSISDYSRILRVCVCVRGSCVYLRGCSDGASYYNHSLNILYLSGLEFNGGTQIHVIGNLFLSSGWSLSRPPDVSSAFNNTIVDSKSWMGGAATTCSGFWNTTGREHSGVQVQPGIYTGDWGQNIMNSTGALSPSATVDWSRYYCGYSLGEWQQHTGQDKHTRHVVNAHGPAGEFGSSAILAKARAMLYSQ